MFKFISTDTLITIDLISEEFQNGGWVILNDTSIDYNDCFDRETTLFNTLSYVSIEDIKDVTFSSRVLECLILEFLESFTNDLKTQIVWVIGMSEEYFALLDWVLEGNNFELDNIMFDEKVALDRENFIIKLFGVLKNKVDPASAKFSDDIGVDIFKNSCVM